MMSFDYSKYIKSITFYCILFLVSMLYILLMAVSTSPIAPHFFGWDSSFFFAVGEAMLRGKLPYIDFFDMKGPYLFLIEMMGCAISSSFGIAFLEILNLFAVLCLIDSCTKLIMGEKAKYSNRFLVIAGTLLLYCDTIDFGNLTEEWSLGPLMLCMYLFLKYVHSENHVHPPVYSFVYGACFSFLALVRITNAALICAVVFTVLVYTIRMNYANITNVILKNAILFILGLIISAIPAVIFCVKNNMLEEMIDCVFIFGFQYGSNGTGWKLTPPMLSLLIAPAGLLARGERADCREVLFIVVSFVVYVFVFTLGSCYTHYFALAIPYIALGFIWMINGYLTDGVNLRRRKIASCIVVFCIVANMFFCLKNVWFSVECVLETDNMREYNLSKEIGTMIPEEDHGSVFGYVNSYIFFKVNNIDNYSKYCSWQENYIKIRPEIRTELEQVLSAAPPRWIVLSHNYLWNFPYLETLLETDYVLFFENDKFLLYKQIV